jgi:paraquat-inducible protein A
MILLTLAIIYHDRLGISTNILKKLIWSYIQIKEWNLIEVYFLGLLISMIKLVELSTMSILPGFWINCIYVVFLYMSVTMFNPYDILHIYKRKPLDRDSIKKSILLLGLAFIFIPASNILPIMPTYKYSVEYPNTILAGIEALYEDGDRAIAIIVFVASVCIPVIKILNVILMILMAQYNIFASYKMRVFMTKFYIFSDAWGKYSMLDVFVVVFASAFIQYDNLVRIEIGSAIIPFTLVVFFTMMASKVFDTRLLWKKR